MQPSKIVRQNSSGSRDVYSQKSCAEPAIDLTEELDEALTLGLETESKQADTTKLDTGKKRKTAHCVVEKNYRSRIMDGMDALRHCVPSAARARSSIKSKLSKGQQVADVTMLKNSSGKVAILSDAVQYVRALELQNEALMGQLDVLQRRNHTLQKIALSKT